MKQILWRNDKKKFNLFCCCHTVRPITALFFNNSINLGDRLFQPDEQKHRWGRPRQGIHDSVPCERERRGDLGEHLQEADQREEGGGQGQEEYK